MEPCETIVATISPKSRLGHLVHGSKELPVVIGELGGDVFRAHLSQDVGCSSLWPLLLLQRELGEEGVVNACLKSDFLSPI